MTDRYEQFVVAVDPAKASALHRQLQDRLALGGHQADLITTPTDTDDSEEEILMSIDEMNASEPAQRGRRSRLYALGAGIVLAAAAVAITVVVVNDDGSSPSDRGGADTLPADPTASTPPASSASTPEPVSTATPSVTNDGVRRLDVGGYTLPIDCRGAGSPTVVYIDGLDTPTESLPAPALFSEELPKTQRVCAYERVGLGSGNVRPDSLPSTTGQGADELASLLAAAGETGPFVLVAHGFGGYFATSFAERYPDQVGGLVMLDVQGVPELMTAAPTRPDGSATVDLKGSKPELIAAGPYGTKPVVVVSTLGNDERILSIHAVVASQSQDSLHLNALKSGYEIYEDTPALVLDAIEEVSAAARTGEPMLPCDARFEASDAECLSADQPAAAGPDELVGWWTSGEITAEDVESFLAPRGFGDLATDIRLSLGLGGRTVIGFGHGWFVVGTPDQQWVDFGTYEVQGDTLVMTSPGATGTRTLKWSVADGALSLDVVSDTLPDFEGIPDLAYALALYDLPTFTPQQ